MDERLDEIIAASLAYEELTQREREILKRWLAEDARHSQEYVLMKQMFDCGEDCRKSGRMEHLKAWQKIWERAAIQQRKIRRIRLGRIAGVVAGFVLLIGISWSLFRNVEEVDSAKYAGIPVPGSGRVQLKLGNGENVELSQVRTSVIVSENRVIAQRDSNMLNYQIDTLQTKMVKPEENILVVPAAAEYRLTLSDGTLVYLNSASELRYPTQFAGDKREVCLKGEAYFEVARDSVRKFIVHTQEMEVEVLGTSFNVNAYPGDEMASITLVSGKVRAICSGNVYNLQPGNQIRRNSSTNAVKIEDVNTEIYTCWKDGYYYFEACRLEEIMQTLSRWYGISVFFVNPELKDVEFSGRLRRYEEAEEWFHKFEQTRNVHFSLKGNTVIISAK